MFSVRKYINTIHQVSTEESKYHRTISTEETLCIINHKHVKKHSVKAARARRPGVSVVLSEMARSSNKGQQETDSGSSPSTPSCVKSLGQVIGGERRGRAEAVRWLTELECALWFRVRGLALS